MALDKVTTGVIADDAVTGTQIAPNAIEITDVSANIIQATLVIFVIGSFISDNPKLLNTIKWIGIIYILYLAYDIYKSRPKSINSDKKSEKTFLSFYKDGFLVACLLYTSPSPRD